MCQCWGSEEDDPSSLESVRGTPRHGNLLIKLSLSSLSLSLSITPNKVLSLSLTPGTETWLSLGGLDRPWTNVVSRWG